MTWTLHRHVLCTWTDRSRPVQMDTFECLYDEGVAGEPKMMTIVLHPHIIGRAARMQWLEK